MALSDGEYLTILRHNVGFDEPEQWLALARQHNFTYVKASTLAACPGCGADLGTVWGRFVHYSTGIGLRECPSCGLCYTDARIDPSVLQAHFETAYKDAAYFSQKRRPTFLQIAALLADSVPQSGQVLDVGGATGELIRVVREQRPDIQFTLNDLSRDACALVEATLDVPTVCAPLSELPPTLVPFDAVVLADVLYYEAAIREVWPTLSELLVPRGLLVLRLPNKGMVIRATSWFQQRKARRRPAGAESLRIPFFNPEHLYLFSRRYIRNQLLTNGFSEPTVLPARPLVSGGLRDLMLQVGWKLCYYLWRVTGVCISPSIIVVARKQ